MMNKKFLLPIGIGLGSVLVLSLVIFFVIAFAANTEDDELTYELALAKAEQMLLIEENKLEMQQASLSAPREVYQANIEVEEEYEYIEEEYEEEPEPLPDPITIRAISALGNPSRGGGLELPVAGATGWAGGYLDLYEEPRHIPPDPVNCLYCNDELCAHCDPYWIEPCAACELCGLCEEEEICMDCVLCEECEELAHALLTGRVSLMRFVSLNYEADYQNELPAQELPYYPEAPETPEAEPAEAYLPHEEIPEEVTPAEYPSECDDCEPEQEPVYQPETYEPETTEYEAQTPRVYRCVCGQLCICWDGCECDQYLCLCMYDCSCGYNCQCEHEQECVCPHVCPCYYCVCGEHCECTQACVCDDYCHCSHDCLCECQCYEEYIPVQIIGRLSPGQVFVILDVHEDFWYIRLPNNNTGWVLHSGCFINLPDVIPSMVFRNTNATASVKRSSWYDIPNVSGYQLYEAWAFNDRLGRYEFIIPVLYQTAHALFVVQ
ncbi:MAG: hypothetical protein FWC89_12525, partial [Defluviitaleaceae bacterium]|nr:hypothetical protein [Defluviitaleaceae bacterium]